MENPNLTTTYFIIFLRNSNGKKRYFLTYRIVILKNEQAKLYKIEEILMAGYQCFEKDNHIKLES